MLALVENLRRKQLAWVDAILLQRNWNLTQLANAAGIDHSTLSKFRNDPDNTKKLSTSTVAAIENASDVPPYQTEIPARLRGLSEVEAAPYQPAPKASSTSGPTSKAAGPMQGPSQTSRSEAITGTGF